MAVIITAILILFLSEGVIMKKVIYQDKNQESISCNPLMGYAISADYKEAVGANTLVYIEILWNEIEKNEGIYDFSEVFEKNYIEEYKKEGKKAVIRFVCDKPSDKKHMDIPYWLYQKTKDGTFYNTDYGMGYSPDYSNEIFIEAHKKAINAIAECFLKDNFVAYVELGSIGHWGEWHVKAQEGIVPLPKEAVCMEYVKHYVQAFKNTRLLMRRPFLGVKEYSLGVYNDMTGDEDATDTWLDWLNNGGEYTEPRDVHKLYKIPDFYKQGAVGGEFTSAISFKKMLGEDLSRTKLLIKNSHMTFIGPMAPHEYNAAQYQKEADEIRQLLGYKLGIEKAVIKYNAFTKNWNIKLVWNNKGIAPIYYNWPVYIYFFDENNEITGKVLMDMDLTKIYPGVKVKSEIKISADELKTKDKKISKIGKIGVGIEDPMFNRPSVRLNNASEDEDCLCIIMYRQ